MNNEKNATFTLACEVVKILKERGWHISFAESCTGGLACAELVGVPDASWVLDASIVTYANEAKIHYLGVSESLIAEYGVVSEQVAGEMAEGVARANSAEVGVGISGIAGPSGGSAEKPVGCVCFGYYINGTVHTERVLFGDLGRNAVRSVAVAHVYSRLCDLIK